MYEEIAELLGLYSYTKDKVNIKPYVVINNSIIKKQSTVKKNSKISSDKPKKVTKKKNTQYISRIHYWIYIFL